MDDKLCYLAFTMKTHTTAEKQSNGSCDNQLWARWRCLLLTPKLNPSLIHSPRRGAALSCGPGARLAHREREGEKKKKKTRIMKIEDGKEATTKSPCLFKRRSTTRLDFACVWTGGLRVETVLMWASVFAVSHPGGQSDRKRRKRRRALWR